MRLYSTSLKLTAGNKAGEFLMGNVKVCNIHARSGRQNTDEKDDSKYILKYPTCKE